MKSEVRNAGVDFVRASLKAARRVRDTLPTLPRFVALPGSRPGRTRFVEETQPNWWQLSTLDGALLDQPEAVAFLQLLERTEPFKSSFGKAIVCPGVTSTYAVAGIARLLLTSYLFAVPSPSWRESTFDKVWRGTQRHFDPQHTSMEYSLFAPIYGLSGLKRRVKLDSNLTIEIVKGKKLASLASREPVLAGVTLMHRYTQWTNYFLVAKFKLSKRIVADDSSETDGDAPFTATATLPEGKPYDVWFSRINEEVAYLRSFLRTSACVPTYAILRDGPPLEAEGGVIPPELPWRPQLQMQFNTAVNAAELRSFRQRRAQFLASHGRPGWASAMASMRRYALAWENPFKADTLSDIVAALERLIVAGDSAEVGYKLRVRTAHWIGQSNEEIGTIMKNIREAYGYRSGVAHGGFVPDHPADLETARRLGIKKSGKNHPVRVLGRIQRLTTIVSDYYRRALAKCVDGKALDVDWESLGL